MIIAVDFDGTIVEHCFPLLGGPVPLAFDYLKQFRDRGARLMLWTMRSDMPNGDYLSQAVQLCLDNGVEFDFINRNPEQDGWTTSHKQYANLYIDDAAFGCPLIHPSYSDGDPRDNRPYVDWSIVGPSVLKILPKT